MDPEYIRKLMLIYFSSAPYFPAFLFYRRPSNPSSSPIVSSPPPPPPRSVTNSPNTIIPRKQQEQQLKDLDTEARLLLIDRSIKSSLVRDHEDISTCIDRLEMLDRIQISLPVLAKCWTVVETIRKVTAACIFLDGFFRKLDLHTL